MSEFDKDYALEQIYRSEHFIRRAIKYFYLNNLMSEIDGPTIDIGCGACQLLRRLPKGSIGIEINPYLVEVMKKNGLNITLAKPTIEESLLDIKSLDKYSCLVLSHVLEHFKDTDNIIRSILRICNNNGIQKVVIVVPGLKGYNYDKTHKTFVNMEYIITKKLYDCESFVITKVKYFPINIEKAGDYLYFNELKIVYEKVISK